MEAPGDNSHGITANIPRDGSTKNNRTMAIQTTALIVGLLAVAGLLFIAHTDYKPIRRIT